jgi:hypothetical protein
MAKLIETAPDLIDSDLKTWTPTIGEVATFKGTTVYTLNNRRQPVEAVLRQVPSYEKDAVDGRVKLVLVRLTDGTLIASANILEYI